MRKKEEKKTKYSQFRAETVLHDSKSQVVRRSHKRGLRNLPCLMLRPGFLLQFYRNQVTDADSLDTLELHLPSVQSVTQYPRICRISSCGRDCTSCMRSHVCGRPLREECLLADFVLASEVSGARFFCVSMVAQEKKNKDWDG